MTFLFGGKQTPESKHNFQSSMTNIVFVSTLKQNKTKQHVQCMPRVHVDTERIRRVAREHSQICGAGALTHRKSPKWHVQDMFGVTGINCKAEKGSRTRCPRCATHRLRNRDKFQNGMSKICFVSITEKVPKRHVQDMPRQNSMSKTSFVSITEKIPKRHVRDMRGPAHIL